MDNLKPGIIGQLKGPFNIGDIIILNTTSKIQLGLSIYEKDAMEQLYTLFDAKAWNWTVPSLIVKIDDQEDTLFVGSRYIYNPTANNSCHKITFPYGAPAGVIIDYMVLE